MTISTTGNRVEYTGNGVTTAFSFPYKFLATSDLVVVETIIATGVETTLTETTDYTVSGAGAAAGGTVTAVTAPASTVYWTIYGDPAISQSTDLVNLDALPANSIEDMADRLTLIAQRTRDIVDRSLHLPDGDVGFTAADMELPAKVDRAGLYMAFDANGKAVPAAGTGNDTALRTDLASSASGSDLVAFADTLTTTYLKTVSDIINGLPVSVFRFIDRSKHASILASSNTDDLTASVSDAMTNGKSIYFPRGTFNLGKVTLANAVDVTGAGRGLTILKLLNSTNDDMFYANAYPSTIDYLSFRNMTIDGNCTNNAVSGNNGNAFQFLYPQYLGLENLLIKNFIWIGTRILAANDAYANNVIMENNRGGLYFAGTSTPSLAHRVYASNCLVYGSTGGDTFSFDNAIQDVTFLNCKSFNSFADGFICFANSGSGYQTQRAQLIGCQAYNPGNNGISIHSSNDVTITNPIIIGAGTLSLSTDSGWGHGIDISNGEANQTQIGNVNIVGGIIRNSQKHGIRMEDTTGTTTVSSVSVNGTQIDTVGMGMTAATYDCINMDHADEIDIDNVKLNTGANGNYGIKQGANVTNLHLGKRSHVLSAVGDLSLGAPSAVTIQATPIIASKSWTVNVVSGANDSTTIGVTGAVIGDRVEVEYAGIGTSWATLTGRVQSADTVRVFLDNIGGTTINATDTLWVYLFKDN